MPTVATSVLAWILLGVAALAIVRMLDDRFRMVSLYGRTRYESCQAITSLLGTKSRRVLQQRLGKWLLFSIGAVAIAEHMQHSSQPWQEWGRLWLPMIALAIGCLQFYGQARPAVVLLLGASTPETLRLHGQLLHGLWPNRSVSLIETGEALDDITHAPGDCFRVTFGEWKDVVWRFARSVLVIVIDIRKLTPPVHEELQFIVNEELQYKTVLIKHADQVLPDQRLADCAVLVTEAECLEKVKHVFASPHLLPSDQHPIRMS
jgi:hypothetical protein